MCRVRLVSLAAQKFVAEVTHDALQLWKQQRQAPQQKLREQGIDPKDRRPVLSMEHVANALQEVASALRTLLIYMHYTGCKSAYGILLVAPACHTAAHANSSLQFCAEACHVSPIAQWADAGSPHGIFVSLQYGLDAQRPPYFANETALATRS